MTRPTPDLAQLLSIERVAIETLVRHYERTGRRFSLLRSGPDAVFADLTTRPRGKRGFGG